MHSVRTLLFSHAGYPPWPDMRRRLVCTCGHELARKGYALVHTMVRRMSVHRVRL